MNSCLIGIPVELCIQYTFSRNTSYMLQLLCNLKECKVFVPKAYGEYLKIEHRTSDDATSMEKWNKMRIHTPKTK